MESRRHLYTKRDTRFLAAPVWLEILSHFGYMKVIIIHSSDTDGRAMLGRFQTTSQTNYNDVDVRATVESCDEFEPKLDSFSSYLMDMKTAQSRVYLLYASQEDAHVIFRDAAIHNMTDYGHIWIVTEQALSANNTPIGIIGLKLNNAENETDHIKDAIYILASAIKEMTVNETITEAPKDCDDSGAIWESGKRLFGYLKTRNIRGQTGQVAFDDNGDRVYAEYDVINVHENHSFVKVGSFHYDSMRNIRGQTGQVAFDDNGDRVYAEYDVINVHENHSFVKVGSFHYDSIFNA
ncbi:glutamate [NMDA] receptor subunit 1-like [Anopheles cruzii]|uniref:glutamate [NMDA] receptor subunit 1-like n=1 Tax=Anopheles cruzii TaxID=68878 RepID=UPI0022EC83DE|nr:glutamate [NMDA] receptor subunit 1-like [Anopheles cruzii]